MSIAETLLTAEEYGRLPDDGNPTELLLPMPSRQGRLYQHREHSQEVRHACGCHAVLPRHTLGNAQLGCPTPSLAFERSSAYDVQPPRTAESS